MHSALQGSIEILDVDKTATSSDSAISEEDEEDEEDVNVKKSDIDRDKVQSSQVKFNLHNEQLSFDAKKPIARSKVKLSFYILETEVCV